MPLSDFFRYASKTDKFILALGILSCIISAILLPGMAILLGSITGTFSASSSPRSLYDEMKWTTLWLAIVGVGSFIFSYSYYTAF